MTLASRAHKRLINLYRGVLIRMGELNARMFKTSLRRPYQEHRCAVEALEPRVLLSLSPLPVEMPLTEPAMTVMSSGESDLFLVEPAAGDAVSVESASSIGLNFEGAYYGDVSYFYPPDTMGAVGEDHVVVLVNGQYSIYDKSDGSHIYSSSLDRFWINAGVSPQVYSFDPRIVYDASTERWFATSVDNKKAANRILVAVSNTSDPTDGWKGYAFDGDPDNTHWADFPMLGFNGDLVVVSANMFAIYSGSSNVSFLVMDKADLLDQSQSPTFTFHSKAGTSTTGFSPQPVIDLDGRSGPLTILSQYDKSYNGYMRRTTVDLDSIEFGDAYYTTYRGYPPNIDQPGSKVDINSFGETRFVSNVMMTGNSIWAVHGVNINNRAALEWYELSATTSEVIQSGTISDSVMAYNMPSIALNDDGDVVIGFSGGSPSQYISSYYALGTTDNGTTTFSDPQLLVAGQGDYQIIDSQGRNRWGDYSATVIDPSNSYEFWTFQEYVKSTNVWGVGVTQILVQPPAGIGDRVWWDENENGIQDSSEQGIAGVTVHLLSSGGTQLASTITDTQGNYWFDDRSSGTYVVEYVLPVTYEFTSQNTGSDDTVDSDANVTTGRTNSFFFTSGTRVDQFDAGLVQQNSSIGDRVWLDENHNGIQDDGELGVADVTVNLLDQYGTELQTTVSDANGAYQFSGLSIGDYIIEFVLPYGYEFTISNAAGDTLDSDADTVTGQSSIVSLDLNQTHLDIDAGLISPPILGVLYVYPYTRTEGNPVGLSAKFTDNDEDSQSYTVHVDWGDGTEDTYLSNNMMYFTQYHTYANDGVYDVIATLTDSSNLSDQESITINVNNVLPTVSINGPYEIAYGANLTLDATGTSDPGSDTLAYEWDLDNDGFYDDATGVSPTFSWEALTALGLTNLGVDYTIRLRVSDDDGSSYASTTLTIVHEVPVADAGGPYVILEGSSLTLDASASTYNGSGVLTYAWDLDNDGVYDDASGMSPTVSWEALHMLGLYNSIHLQVTDAENFTDSQTTTLAIHNVSPVANAGGPYAINEGESLILDASGSSDAGGDSLTYAWDLDNDGVYDDATGVSPTVTWSTLNALGISGVGTAHTIGLQVKDTENARSNRITSLTISDVPPVADAGGVYVINEGSPVTLNASGSSSFDGSPMTYAWDLDNDGVYDDATGMSPTVTWATLYALGLASEGSAQIISVQVTDITNSSSAASSTLTIYNQLPVISTGGTYVIYEGTDLALDASNTTDADGDILTYAWDLDNDGIFDDALGVSPTVNWENLVSLGLISQQVDYHIGLQVTDDAGSYVASTTFSIQPVPANASISGVTWIDRDFTHLQSDGDTFIADVVVELYDSQENLLQSTLTDINGSYTFSGLLPGDYKVKFEKLSNEFHYFVIQKIGGGYWDGINSDPNSGTGWTDTITVGVAEQVVNCDAGYNPNGIMRFYVWLDENANGTYEIGEKDAAGIVEIEISEVDGTYYSKKRIYPNNHYTFAVMNSGDYQVHLLLNDGYELVAPYQGSDEYYDSDIDPVTLTSVFTIVEGQFDPYIGIGILGTGRIGNHVWLDQNANGIEDVDEHGLANVTVNLLYDDGDFCQTTVTDENGDYLFDHVVEGDYIIEFVTPDGTYLTTQNTGADDTIDSDANSNTGRTAILSLSENGRILDVNAGLIGMPELGQITITPDPGLEGSSVGLAGSLSHLDAANQSHSVVIQWGDGESDIVNLAAGALSFSSTHTYADDGEYDITVTATDLHNEQDQQTISLTIDNVLPVADAGDAYVIAEGTSLTLDATGSTDAGSDSLAYAWDLDNDGEYDDATGVSPTVAWDTLNALGLASDGSVHTIGLQVADTELAIDVTTTTLTINNVLPVADAGDAYVIAEGTSLTLDASGSTDAGGDSLIYAWDLDNDGEYDDAIGMSPTVTWDTLNALGLSSDGTAHQIGLQVTDDIGSSTASTTLTLNNIAPIAHAGDAYVISEGSSLTLDATGSTDAGGDSLTYAWDLDNDGEYDDAIGMSPTVTWDTLNALGLASDGSVHTIGLQVSDDGDLSTSTASLTINNILPTVISGGAYQINEGSSLTLDASGSTDAGSDSLTYAWDLDNDGEYDDVIGVSPTVAWDTLHAMGLSSDGTAHTVGVRVSDDTGSSTASTTLSIYNVAPVSNIGDAYVINEGSSLILDATGSTDAGSDSLTYAWDLDNDGVYDDATGVSPTITWGTLDALGLSSDGSDHTIGLQVTDTEFAIDVTTTTLTINNVLPVTAAGGIYVIDEGDVLSLDASGTTDIGGDLLTYAWDLDDDGLYDDASGASPIIGWSTLNALGLSSDGIAHQIGLQVTDDIGSSTTFTELIINNLPPVVDAGLDQTTSEAVQITLTGSATDLDVNDTHTLTWDFGDGSQTVVGTQVQHTYPDNGSYTVTLTALDQDGGQATDSLLVTVNNTDPTIDSLAGDVEVFGGFEAQFNASASDAAGSHDPLTYTWDFGDGSDPVTGQNLTSTNHTYTQFGLMTVTLTVADDDGGQTQDTWFVTVKRPVVTDQFMFYNNTIYDGNGSQVSAIDANAIDTSKTALLPGETADTSNYSTCVSGINGIMIDVLGLADPSVLTIDDLELRVGNDNQTNSWSNAPQATLNLLQGAGENGTDRLVITWPDESITQTWLEVRLLANTNTKLQADHVFYFGNMIGEVTGDGFVSISDVFKIWNNRREPGIDTQVPVTNQYDLNQDGWVTITDVFLAWNNRAEQGIDAGLSMIQPPVENAPLVQSIEPVQVESRLAMALASMQGRYAMSLVQSDSPSYQLADISISDYLLEF